MCLVKHVWVSDGYDLHNERGRGVSSSDTPSLRTVVYHLRTRGESADLASFAVRQRSHIKAHAHLRSLTCSRTPHTQPSPIYRHVAATKTYQSATTQVTIQRKAPPEADSPHLRPLKVRSTRPGFGSPASQGGDGGQKIWRWKARCVATEREA
jgi:hypothetical protein